MSLLDFDAPADAYAVMGNPIAHSKSPLIHGLFAKQTGERIEYTAILVDRGGFEQAVGNFQGNGGKGLNATVPFKEDAWELVDERSDLAERAGAVNTIVCREDGTLYGHNTDGIGLLRDLRVNLGIEVEARRILLLGAGGAARGVLQPLLGARPERLFVANRTPDRAVTLAQDFKDLGPIGGGGFDDLSGNRFDLVINGTAASLQGKVPPLPEDLLAEGAHCYDMMYAAEPTAFLQWATAHGAAATADGLGMLVEQAAESFLLWRAKRPDTTPVIEAVRQALSAEG